MGPFGNGLKGSHFPPMAMAECAVAAEGLIVEPDPTASGRYAAINLAAHSGGCFARQRASRSNGRYSTAIQHVIGSLDRYVIVMSFGSAVNSNGRNLTRS
jgi:hypothetical protein